MSPRKPPFVMFSLPRSRSAWLSVFLASPDRPVGHDVGVECASPDGFVERLRFELAGTCETGAMFAWRLIRKRLPQARFAVIVRSPVRVAASLASLGLGDHRDEMLRRWGQLQEIAAEPGVLTVQFDALAERSQCAALYRHCRGEEMPDGWWEQLESLNVQVDMPRQIGRLVANRERIASLKAAVAAELADA